MFKKIKKFILFLKYVYVNYIIYMLFYSPLEQFEVVKICSVHDKLSIYFNYYSILIVICIWQVAINGKFTFVKSSFEFFSIIVEDSVKKNLVSSTIFGSFFFNLYLAFFFLLLFSNVLGLLPYGFTMTAHLIITISLSFFFFMWLTAVFTIRHVAEWGNLFLPGGTPILILPLIIPIEILSYFSRVLSLSIRLFANLMSGHTLLHILVTFLFINISFNLFNVIPLLIIQLILFMEVGVAFLQIYVFLVLIGLYLQDTMSLNTH